MQKVGEIIRDFRVRKNYTQDNMAEELKLSRGSYQNYENGKTEITISRLYEIAKILNVSIVELLGETKPEPDYKDCPNCARLEKVIDNQSNYIKMLEQKCNGNELEKRKAS